MMAAADAKPPGRLPPGPRKPKPPPATPYRVFLSHASVDKFVARCILEKIEATGATGFIDDRDIEGGDNIPDAIFANVAAAHEVLLLLTPKSVQRQWVMMELGAAKGRGIRVVPVLYQLDRDQIPAAVQNTKWYDINDFDQYLDGLKSRLTGRPNA